MLNSLVRYISMLTLTRNAPVLKWNSGLHRYPSQHRFQTIQNRYDTFVSAVSNFAIIQFGICTFHWSSTANRYFAKPFNFYVFPRSTKGRKEMNRCFGVQGEAFDFLTTCGFDFNKVLYPMSSKFQRVNHLYQLSCLHAVGLPRHLLLDARWREKVWEGWVRKIK